MERTVRFGNYVSKRRKELGISQKDLAERILKEDGSPISPQYLNDIEHGRRNPPPQEIIDQFAELLEVSHEYLHFLAGELPEDLHDITASPDQVEAAFSAFRKTLRGK